MIRPTEIDSLHFRILKVQLFCFWEPNFENLANGNKLTRHTFLLSKSFDHLVRFYFHVHTISLV